MGALGVQDREESRCQKLLLVPSAWRNGTGFKRPSEFYLGCESGDTIVPPYLPPSTDPIHSRTILRTAGLQGPGVLAPRAACF